MAKKAIIEKGLLKTFKKLGENSSAPAKELIKAHCLFLLPIFKINKTKRKTSLILWTQKAKLSLAIKLIINDLNNRKAAPLYEKLYAEIHSTIMTNNNITESKNKIQRQALLARNFFFYYKWH